MKKIKSINIMLWRYVGIFSILIIALIVLICYVLLGSAYLTRVRERVDGVGGELKAFMQEERSGDEVWSKICGYSSEGVAVYVITPSGDLALPENFEKPDGWDRVFDKISSSLDAENTGASVNFNLDRFQSYAASVNYLGQPHYLLVRYSVSVIVQSTSQMQIYISLIAVAAIFIVFILSYALAQKLTRPFKTISATATKLAKGDYGVNFSSAEYQEIAQLSETLNYLRDEVKKSDEFQKQLIANVSHDLKTPLTMIKAYASMVKEISGDDPEKRDKHLQVIIDESDRLTGLVNDVLTASKISAGLQQLNKKVFNLTEYLYSIIDKFGFLQETQGYVFMVDIDADLYTLADQEKIGQVIYNLISNAVNYTGGDKTVYISLKDQPAEKCIKFSVRDTGSGISDEELVHIWDRYYRTNDAHTRPVKGTGLGLNIVKSILSGHAFRFGVNTGKDGSVFYVCFPSVTPLPEDGAEQ